MLKTGINESPAALIPEIPGFFRRKQTLTDASLEARRRNARKSTGPRTSQGKARVALNSFKHGLRSASFLQTLRNAGEPTRKFERAQALLVKVLRPRNRLEAARAMRYAQMLWALGQRMEKHRRARRAEGGTKLPLNLSKAARAHQLRVMKDLRRAWKGTNYDARRAAGSVIRLMTITGWILDAAMGKPKNDKQSWNIL
jgi:hypothetical protein